MRPPFERAAASSASSALLERGCVALEILERAHALRESVEANEAGGVALLVDVVLAEGDEALVVQRLVALAAGDGDGSLAEAQRDRAGDALLRRVDERVVRLALGGPPATLVHEVRVARRDEILGGESAAIEHELLELGVRELEQRAAGGLVDAAGLHSDEAILDEIDAADAVPAADRVELLDQGDGGERLAVDGDGCSGMKADRDVLRRSSARSPDRW